ncbi:MAG TPA: hypothetical protein VGH74_07980, partial [Planctomycetaceae bacterium]
PDIVALADIATAWDVEAFARMSFGMSACRIVCRDMRYRRGEERGWRMGFLQLAEAGWRPDTGRCQQQFVLRLIVCPFGPITSFEGAGELLPGGSVGMRDAVDRDHEAATVFVRQDRQQTPVVRDLLDNADGLVQFLG